MSVTGAIIGLAVGNRTIDDWGLPTTVTVLGAVAIAAVPLIMMLPETKGAILHHDGRSPATREGVQVVTPGD
jgi:hypothetical protein